MSPIHKGVSIGNTFLNVLEGLPDAEFFSVYTKSGAPDARIQSAFQISEKMLVNKLLHKTNTVGRRVEERDVQTNAQPDKLVTFAQKKRYTVLFWGQALVWTLPYWKSDALHAFLDECQPDILFTLLSDSVPLNKLICHIQAYLQKPLVIYAWDNNYTLKMGAVSPLCRLNRHINRIYMRATVKKAAQMYVISDVQKRDYEKAFGIPCKVLTKSADFSGDPPVKTKYHEPMQIVFTGNIGTNRWKSLAMIARALQTVNRNGVRAQLRIYTSTPLTDKMKAALEIADTSFLMGSVPASEIPCIQSDADMLVHVEAFDRQNRLAVRQSFSTKLVDYFKAARPILAVGPRDVASIEHLIANDCALTAQTEAELVEKLTPLIGDSDALTELARRAYDCGRAHHDKSKMDAMLFADLQTAARGEKMEH